MSTVKVKVNLSYLIIYFFIKNTSKLFFIVRAHILSTDWSPEATEMLGNPNGFPKTAKQASIFKTVLLERKDYTKNRLH